MNRSEHARMLSRKRRISPNFKSVTVAFRATELEAVTFKIQKQMNKCPSISSWLRFGAVHSGPVALEATVEVGDTVEWSGTGYTVPKENAELMLEVAKSIGVESRTGWFCRSCNRYHPADAACPATGAAAPSGGITGYGIKGKVQYRVIDAEGKVREWN